MFTNLDSRAFYSLFIKLIKIEIFAAKPRVKNIKILWGGGCDIVTNGSCCTDRLCNKNL